MAFDPARQGMGIGRIGIGDPNVVFKRKFRWTLEIAGNGFVIPPFFCKVAARPNISFEETEINFLNDKTWLPGKASWEAITVTYMDVAGILGNGATGANLALYQWLVNVFDFSSPISKKMNSKLCGYAGRASLILWDGCGTPLETWTLLDAWPQAINFGDLDYSSSDTVDIELTMRYSQVNFVHNCPDGPPKAICIPCAAECPTLGVVPVGSATDSQTVLNVGDVVL